MTAIIHLNGWATTNQLHTQIGIVANQIIENPKRNVYIFMDSCHLTDYHSNGMTNIALLECTLFVNENKNDRKQKWFQQKLEDRNFHGKSKNNSLINENLIKKKKIFILI